MRTKDESSIEPEIRVTPAMIEAGAGVLCRMELAFASEEFYAEKVYRAMVIAERHPENLSPIELETLPA